MGGEIGVESVPGQGSTFWFTARFRSSSVSTLPAPAVGEIRGARVLIVDDNETNRTILQYQSAAWGMEAHCAPEAASALRELVAARERGARYDLVILDLDMPGMNGIELARAVRSNPDLAATKLVLLASAQLAERAGEDGRPQLDAWLTKPVRREHLRRTLMEVFGAGPSQPAAEILNQPPPSPVPSERNVRVLVAEDNPVNQRVAVQMLESRGCRVDVVANGRQAVDAIGHISYDLILMDCQMPEMDGYEATRRIRHKQEGRSIPIVAMTANALPGDDRACYAAGMDDYLTKPVGAAKLESVLDRWCVGNAGSSRDEAPTSRDGGRSSGSSWPHAPVPDTVIDPTTLSSLSTLGGQDMLDEILTLFVQDTPARIASLDAALREADTLRVRREAHALKGSCRSLGAVRMGALCDAIERSATSGEMDTTGALIDDLERTFRSVQTELGSVRRAS
jgi:CheY-like chemotaxis protein